MTARERAREAGRLLRKLLKGKTQEQRRSYARGWWTVAVDNDKPLKEHYDAFSEECGL